VFSHNSTLPKIYPNFTSEIITPNANPTPKIKKATQTINTANKKTYLNRFAIMLKKFFINSPSNVILYHMQKGNATQ